MTEKCAVPSAAPQLIQDFICIPWEAFSLYYHIGMIAVVLGFLFVVTPVDEPDNDEPLALFEVILLVLLTPIIYFTTSWVYIFIVIALPIPESVFGAHPYEVVVVLIPMIFLSIFACVVAERYTGIINR